MRAAELPAANGVTNARSLARLYAAAVGEVDDERFPAGSRSLDAATVADAATRRTAGNDRC